MMLLLSFYPISNENKLPTIETIKFVVVEFWTRLKDWTLIIFDEIPCKNSCTYFLMYLKKAVLDHCPIYMIEKTGTSP